MSPMTLRHRAVMADWGNITCRQRGPAGGVSRLLMGSEMLALVGMPSPVGTDEAVERLMLAKTLDEGVTCSLVVAALDVEVAEEWLEDERGVMMANQASQR